MFSHNRQKRTPRNLTLETLEERQVMSANTSDIVFAPSMPSLESSPFVEAIPDLSAGENQIAASHLRAGRRAVTRSPSVQVVTAERGSVVTLAVFDVPPPNLSRDYSAVGFGYQDGAQYVCAPEQCNRKAGSVKWSDNIYGELAKLNPGTVYPQVLKQGLIVTFQPDELGGDRAFITVYRNGVSVSCLVLHEPGKGHPHRSIGRMRDRSFRSYVCRTAKTGTR